MSFNHAFGYLQRVSGPQILRESRRRIEDTTEPKKGRKKDGKQILCFRTKTAHIQQLLFDPIGPFSYVLSHISLFILSTAHPAGGLPIGVILTSDEKESTIRCGLKNLIEALPSYAFCGEGAERGPTLCMTDDSGTEKGALRSVWSNSTQLLCIFHFLQRRWTWLYGKK